MIDLTTGWWYGYKTLDLLEEVNRRLDNNGDNKLTKDQAIRSLIPMLYTNAHVFVEKPLAMSVAETANPAKVSVKENPTESFFITVTFATN